MFLQLKEKTIALTKSRIATWWLGIIAFIESSFFPIPADVLFVPMSLLQKHRAYFFAMIATVTSCLGGVFGYFIGLYGYEIIVVPVFEVLGKTETLLYYRNLIQHDYVLLWVLLLSSGFTHLPPIKVVTILSGIVGVDFWLFLISAIIGRGGRFFLLAWIIKHYGNYITTFLKEYNKLIMFAGIAIIMLFIGYKLWI